MWLLFMLLRVILSGLLLASGVFIDFRLTTHDPNHLTLECFNDATEDIDHAATIFFFNSLNANSNSERIGSIFSGGTFNITPRNEAFLRCTSGDGMMQSEFVAIGGK